MRGIFRPFCLPGGRTKRERQLPSRSVLRRRRPSLDLSTCAISRKNFSFPPPNSLGKGEEVDEGNQGPIALRSVPQETEGTWIRKKVPERGFEPPRPLRAHGPEPCASANSATPANSAMKHAKFGAAVQGEEGSGTGVHPTAGIRVTIPGCPACFAPQELNAKYYGLSQGCLG